MYNIQPEYDRNSGNSLSSDTIVDNHHQTGREVNNRPLFNYGIHSPSTVTNGRLDLSFTKCNFPDDYLPYAGGGGKKRHDSHSNDLNYRHSTYDNFVFGLNEDDYTHNNNGSRVSEFNEPYFRYPETNVSKQPSTFGTSYTFNSLERGRRDGIFTSNLVSVYNEHPNQRQQSQPSYHRSSNSTMTLPLALPCSSSTTSSSCLTTHHLHPNSNTNRNRKWFKSFGCCILILVATLVLIILSLVVGFSLYLAIVTNFMSKSSSLIYSISGNFKVVSGDTFTIRLLNQSSDDYVRKTTRYDEILQHVLEKSELADSLLKSEVYTFRHGSLIVFFRFYASKVKVDNQLDLHSKAIINLNSIENVYIDDIIILNRIRDLIRSAFRSSRIYLTQMHNDIVIDIDSIKIGHIDQMNELQYRMENMRRNKESLDDTVVHISSMSSSVMSNVNSHKVANIVTRTDDGPLRDHSSPFERQQSSPSSTTTPSTLVNNVQPQWPLSTSSSTSESAIISTSRPSTTTTTTTTTMMPTTITTITTTIRHQPKLTFTSERSPPNNRVDKGQTVAFIDETNLVTTNRPKLNTIEPNNHSTSVPLNMIINNIENGDHWSPDSMNITIDQSSPTVIESSVNSKFNIETLNDEIPQNNSKINMNIAQINHNIKEEKVNSNFSETENNVNITWNKFVMSTSTKSSVTDELSHGSEIKDIEIVEAREDNFDKEQIEKITTIKPETESNHTNVSMSNYSIHDDIWDLPPQENMTNVHKLVIDTLPINNNNNESHTKVNLTISNDEMVSVDGFSISSNNNSTIDWYQTTPKPADRILVASEESFDLYSIPQKNRTQIGLPIHSSPELSGTEFNIGLENNSENSDDSFLFSSQVDGATFGKRISKKLFHPSYHHQTDKENNRFGTNGLFKGTKPISVDDDEKLNVIEKANNTISLEEYNDVNGPHLNDDVGEIDWYTTTTTTTTSTSTTTTIATTETISMCDANQFQCLTSTDCIAMDDVCNLHYDCDDRSDESICRCVDYLVKNESHRNKVCDGIIHCNDQSDELDCPGCREGMFVCSSGSRRCFEMTKKCDGEIDCENGEDEQGCITLMHHEEMKDRGETSLHSSSRIGEHFNSNGILVVTANGHWGPLCFDNYDLHSNEVSLNTSTSMLQFDDMGRAACKANFFNQLDSIDLVTMNGERDFYSISDSVRHSKPTLSIWSSLFELSNCSKRKVAHISCSDFACGIRPVSSKLRRRIVGGHGSSFGSWPWQVALYRDGQYQCAAILIDSQWLLSAAHCFFHSSPSAYWAIRAGVYERSSTLRSYHEQVRRVERIILHPRYVDKGFQNDIALLKLDSPLRFSKYVRPICLPTESDNVDNWHNQLCSTVGWGKLYEEGRIFPDNLQEVKLPIISSEECRKRTLFLPLYKVTNDNFCAGFENGGKDACLGDSGGPMMCQKADGKWLLLGITSNGDGCGRAGRPGVYTKVASYLSWIGNIISNSHKLPRLPEIKCNSTEHHRCPLGMCLPFEQKCEDFSDESDDLDTIAI